MIMMALNEDQAAKLFAMMTDEEIKGITQAMAELGSIKGSTVEALFVEFADQMSATGSFVGSFDSTERLLLKFSIMTVFSQSWRKSAVPPGAPCGTSSAT